MNKGHYNTGIRKVKYEYFVTGFLFCMLFITLLRSQILKDGSGFLASYLSPIEGRPARQQQGGFSEKKCTRHFYSRGGQATSARPDLYEHTILGYAGGRSGQTAVRPASFKELLPMGGGPPPDGYNRPPRLKTAFIKGRGTMDEGRGTKKDWLDELIDKIHLVESGGQLDPAAGDNGRAVGTLQIHRCAVDDVNHYYKTNFSYTDRGDFTKARLIARLYIQIWMEKHREEIAARIFNGGPRGWRKKSTDAYWRKIQGVE